MPSLSASSCALTLLTIPIFINSILTLLNPTATMSTFHFSEPEAARVLGMSIFPLRQTSSSNCILILYERKAISTLTLTLQSFLAAYQNNHAYMYIISVGKLIGGLIFWTWRSARNPRAWRNVAFFEWLGACVILGGLVYDGRQYWSGVKADMKRRET